MLAALLAARGSEVAGMRAGDVDWGNRIVWIRRQHYPGRGGLVVKQTKGRRNRPVPMLDALEPTLERLTEGKALDDPLLRGPRGGVLATATVRDATHWDDLVAKLGFDNLTRHGLRHTGATWMADAGLALHVLQEILGHQSIETTKGYLHPDHRHLAEPPDKPTSSSSQPPPEGTPPAATDPACDRPRTHAPTLQERAGAPSCPDSGPLRGHLLVHFAGENAERDWSTSAAAGSSSPSEWTSQ
ncbi:tyrosine-type recombinase/integrase [Microbacterium sp. Leaf151]|uniref:tyrosine-type recombinase/integrase n=1 Tax=Microbacterium sp. Leaf151 TaxID=1736276 RepID=UPI001F2C9888|nr:tyrosine-type recombinase/integrase [Microbacterium sp. Leaf151]